MKRAVLFAARGIRIEETTIPKPSQGEALVRIQAVGLCGSDLHLYKDGVIGGVPIDASAGAVPGHECVGIVEDVGPGTDRTLVGQRVSIEPAIACGRCRYCLEGKPNVCPSSHFLGLPPRSGALAERIVHPVSLCEPLPDEIDDDEGVLLEPLAIAVHSLDRVGVTAGASVAVLGAGTIGLTHTLLLARSGVRPLIVTDPLQYRLDFARDLGATHVLNPRSDDVVEITRQLTGGLGADLVFECAGEPETFEQMVDLASPAGRVGVVGIPGEDRLSFRHSTARRKGLDVLMIRRSNRTFHRALEWTLRDALPLSRLATHRFPLEQTVAAFETASAYRDGAVKVVVRCND
ncbi:MAG: alcohol dehydrogenase catalytic domain-containing protein [Vicinamibacteria bacterium]|nr:alcohol dehydrogenase catalytic domain-containing protein [Vicinamibacteria bacterium]